MLICFSVFLGSMTKEVIECAPMDLKSTVELFSESYKLLCSVVSRTRFVFDSLGEKIEFKVFFFQYCWY
jgi:hypothetical protein